MKWAVIIRYHHFGLIAVTAILVLYPYAERESKVWFGSAGIPTLDPVWIGYGFSHDLLRRLDETDSNPQGKRRLFLSFQSITEYMYKIQGNQGVASILKMMSHFRILSWPLNKDRISFAAHEDPATDVLDSKQSNNSKPKRWNKNPTPKRITAFSVIGSGIGYDLGFAGLDAMFASEYPAFTVMPFIEAQGMFVFDNSWAANLGVGGRCLLEKIPAMVGLNAFYSFRQGHHGIYNGIGMGFELIGRRWELNVNGYAPLGNTLNFSKTVYDDYFGDYKAVRKKIESSLYGGDIGLSLLALQAGDFRLYALGGPYFLTGKFANLNARGWQFSLQSQFGDYFALSFAVSTDVIFGKRYQGGFALTLPLYKFTKLKKHRVITNRQIYQPVKRMIPIIPLESHRCWNCNF